MSGGGALVPTVEQIETLRDLFFKKLEREGTPFEDGFDPRDIERIRSNNRYLEVFLEAGDLDMKHTLKVLWDVCCWRKSYGTNDIAEHNVHQDELYSGKVFPHNRDVDGKRLLIFKTKQHHKGKRDVDDVIRAVLYWLERLQRENNFDQISVVFDMNSTGLSNMDMEFTKRIIDAFKLYYPYMLNYIIIIDLPWILTAAFKIVKSLLPPKAAAKMKFVNLKNISEFIDENNLLACWGGSDDYVFSFVPEVGNGEMNYVNHNNNNYEPNMPNANDPNSSTARKVHFANSSPPDSPMTEQAQSTINDKAELLSISPSDAIVFTKSGNEFVGTVGILNISENNVTYKIKTTSPEKFRVRPSSGCLSSGSETRINVVLQQGQSLSTINKDKFLVMSLALAPEMGTNTQAIADLWKNTPANSSKVEQCRLKCILEDEGVSGSGDGMMNGRLSSPSYKNAVDCDRQMYAMLSQLTETTTRLEKQLTFSHNLQWITLSVFLLLFIVAVYTLKQDIYQNGTCDSHAEL